MGSSMSSEARAGISDLLPRSTARPVADSVLDLIGATPLIELSRAVPHDEGATIFVKHEGYNPGGSLRDRTLLEILNCASGSGLLKAGDEIVLAGANNSAISAALIAHSRGYRVRVFHPRDGDRRLLKLLMETGARLSRSPRGEGLEGAREAAVAYASEGADRIFIDGTRREATVGAFRAIARELIQALGDTRLGGVVTSVSTGAAFRHLAQALREHNPEIEVAGVMIEAPEERRALYDDVAPDQRPTTDDLKEVRGELIQIAEIEAWRMRGQIARREGVLLGPKGAAAVLGALQIRHAVPPGQAIVALSIDGGQRYLSATPTEIAEALAH